MTLEVNYCCSFSKGFMVFPFSEMVNEELLSQKNQAVPPKNRTKIKAVRRLKKDFMQEGLSFQL